MPDVIEDIGKRRLIFGHRGAPDETPENTIAGFQRSVELGLDGVELDARFCKSGELVVFHDDKVEKITDGSGNIEELSLDELKELDAGSHAGSEFKGEKIPLLEEVLEVLGGKMIINVELKTRSVPDDELEAEVIRLIKTMGLESSVILSSFNPFSVGRARKLDPGMTAALLYAEDQAIYLRQAWGSYLMRLDGIHPKYPLVSEKLMRRAKAKKWFVCTWTVDDMSMAEKMFDMGIDIVITNHPRKMIETLSS